MEELLLKASERYPFFESFINRKLKRIKLENSWGVSRVELEKL